MNSIHPPALPNSPSARRRSLFVTLLAWAIIAISTLLLPISLMTLLMILAGSQGTSTFNPLGFVGIVMAPAASVVAGIGLLCRRNWGRYFIIILFALLIAYNGWQLVAAGPETTTYTSSTGVKTTVETSYGYKGYNLPIMLVCALLLAGLCRRSVRDEFKSTPTPPPLATSPLAAPPASTGGHAGISPPMTTTVPSQPSPARQRLVLWLVISIMMCIAGGLIWLATSGIQNGETYLPSSKPSQRRTIIRQDEPATYWLSIGIYGLAGLASAAAGLWLTRQALRPTPPRPRSAQEDYGR